MVTSISINLDGTALKVAGDAFGEQAVRLATLLEDLPPDHWARLFELPLSDLAEALTDTGMLALTEKRDGVFAIIPHPALVNFGGLIAAVSDGIEAKLAADKAEGGA
jgi:hypothetical protein